MSTDEENGLITDQCGHFIQQRDRKSDSHFTDIYCSYYTSADYDYVDIGDGVNAGQNRIFHLYETTPPDDATSNTNSAWMKVALNTYYHS